MSHPVAIEIPPISQPRRKFQWKVSTMALPLAAYLVLFFVIPFAVILWYSFGQKPNLYVTHDNSVLSLDRYFEALSPSFLTIFAKTLRIALIGTVITLLIAYPIAYWMARKLSPRARNIVLVLVLIPYWTNFLVRTLGWQIALNPDGFISTLLQKAGVISQPLEFLNTVSAVQLGVVYNYLPLMILPIYVTLEQMDWRLLEANSDLGGSAAHGFFRITLPLSMGGVSAALLLVFVPLMGDYITPQVLGGAKGTMVGQMVANQFQSAQNWALGSAMAILLMLMILLVVVAVNLIGKAVTALLRRGGSLTSAVVAWEGN